MLPLRPRKFHLTAVKSRLNVLTRLLVILYITLSAIYLYMSRDPSPPAWGFHRNGGLYLAEKPTRLRMRPSCTVAAAVDTLRLDSRNGTGSQKTEEL
ncbi:uncharacterized protein ATNIH1004_011738 [Aspergillus tanneri]|uniref:Uncharacterized protein n=1 Tax=Aspergillus tanneri TaxID=1220188 RepID=A0A5M9M3J2_9EURO|nr:uncharacterized protein ATNIH1004_011738 [Aspergillus tanneri]KAA8641602.1 hypothetical protein ATNIH1004_011738 [Aspergillus tanneri]